VNYIISVGGTSITSGAAVYAFPLVAEYTAGIAGISLIAPPTASFVTATTGFSFTNYGNSYVNGKPFDLQDSTRQSTIWAAGLAYPPYSPYSVISSVLKIPGVASRIAGPDATNKAWDKLGGAKGGKS